ncbi:MAG TPA: tetratricopeptide repeat protein, partial [Candidatus Obscuribacterales bacterium]
MDSDLSEGSGEAARAGLEQAYRCLSAGQPEAALALFQALSMGPARADALNGLGLCAEARGDLAAAEAFYREALVSREEAEFLNNLAICLQSQGKAAEALQAFKRLAQLRPEPAVLYNLALLLASARAYWEALDVLDQVLGGRSGLPEPVLLLLELIKALAYQPDVYERLQQRLGQEPQAAGRHLALAAWHDLRGQDQSAVRYFRSALRANPALLEAYRQLVYSLQDKGQHSRALATARQLFASELAPATVLEMISVLQQPIAGSEAQIRARRTELESLVELFLATHSEGSAPLNRPIHQIPFLHTYQWGEDRPLQARLAALYALFLQRPGGPETELRLPLPSGSRPRLGIVSSHFYRHSVMDLLLRAVETLFASPDFETWLLL